MRKEIEVKARTNNISDIVERLKKLGCVIEAPIRQDDVIFVDAHCGSFTDFQPGKNILRLRKSNGKIMFTLKQPQTNELDAIEREVEVSNLQEMTHILELLGYHRVITVGKTRSKTSYKDWEICLDEVDNLGSFVEVEKITEDESAATVQRELWDFLLSLGVKNEDRILSGYDTLAYLKKSQP